jgi:hypothetical protein
VADPSDRGPLWAYVQGYDEGPGIFKWEHYLEIYHRHLNKFVGAKPSVVEVGIYSGGSLGMWRSYFGEGCHVHGVDIVEDCRSYASDHVTVHIGDQADRSFWADFRDRVPVVDALIDDGGHTALQQQVTLEEMLPHLQPGGVYICEDIHRSNNRFTDFASGLVRSLNEMDVEPGPVLMSRISNFQAAVYSMHFYPYILVVEKNAVSPVHFVSPRRGTDWMPGQWG